MKIFFFKKSKIGHGGSPRNRIPQGTTVTEFSKTFPVFYKWPDLTDVQGIVTSTVPMSRRTRVESFGPLSMHSKCIVQGVLGGNDGFEIVISRIF